MIVRPFRESAEDVVAWIDDQPVSIYEHGVSDILSSRYWQISETDFWENFSGFFNTLPAGHLLGLSLDFPSMPDSKGEVTTLVKRTIDVLIEVEHVLTELHSLYIYSNISFDVAGVLGVLPDLKNLLLWGCDLDLSFVRHANLEWLSSDSGRPIAGLDMASLPALSGMEFDEISKEFLDSMLHSNLPKLQHFGVIGLSDIGLSDVLAHPAFPKSITSFYVDACYTDTDAKELRTCLAGLSLERLCIRDQSEHWQDVYTAEHLPQITHLGILDAPEDDNDIFAVYVTGVLVNPACPQSLTSLDLHGVPLDDEQVGQLLELPWFKQLRYLNITFHRSLSEETVAKISALIANGCTVLGLE